MKYYYLISSLPEIKVDDSSLSQEMLENQLNTIDLNLSAQDKEINQCLLHISDNQNLLYVLFHEYHDLEIQRYHRPGVLSKDILENYRREIAALPDYMINYLTDFSGSFSSMNLREMEGALDRYFYSHVERLDSLFLNTYFSWRFKLKRVLADVSRKTYDFLHTKNEEEEPFFTPTKALHDLSNREEIIAQMSPLVERNDLEGIEQQVNQYYWNFAAMWKEPFTAEQVFAQTIRIIRMHRWKGFSKKGDDAQASFEQRIFDLKKRELSPKMPVI